MKSIFNISTALFILSYNLCSQWFTQPSGTVYPLKAVFFINENTGFICSENIILNTADGGTSWFSRNLLGRNNDIRFVNAATGFICSDSGRIHKTTDMGLTWSTINTGTQNHLMRMNFINENTGLAVGFKRTILKTTDSGESWVSLITNQDTLNFLGCRLINDNVYIVTGTGSSIYRSTNSGTTWIASDMGVVNPLWAPEFINDNTGWITGCCGMFIKTTNGGLSWTPEIYLTLGFTIYTMKFVNSTTGFLCGDNGILYRTIDQGNGWDSTVTGTNQILNSVFMINGNTGWVAGNYGTILKTTNGGGTGYTIGIRQTSTEIPKEFYLSDNYPNPFNPSTKIKFQIPKLSYIKITVFDVLGREVSALVDHEVKPGIYEIDFDGSKFASGIYYCNLNAESFVITKKMVLIK